MSAYPNWASNVRQDGTQNVEGQWVNYTDAYGSSAPQGAGQSETGYVHQQGLPGTSQTIPGQDGAIYGDRILQPQAQFGYQDRQPLTLQPDQVIPSQQLGTRLQPAQVRPRQDGSMPVERCADYFHSRKGRQSSLPQDKPSEFFPQLLKPQSSDVLQRDYSKEIQDAGYPYYRASSGEYAQAASRNDHTMHYPDDIASKTKNLPQFEYEQRSEFSQKFPHSGEVNTSNQIQPQGDQTLYGTFTEQNTRYNVPDITPTVYYDPLPKGPLSHQLSQQTQEYQKATANSQPRLGTANVPRPLATEHYLGKQKPAQGPPPALPEVCLYNYYTFPPEVQKIIMQQINAGFQFIELPPPPEGENWISVPVSSKSGIDVKRTAPPTSKPQRHKKREEPPPAKIAYRDAEKGHIIVSSLKSPKTVEISRQLNKRAETVTTDQGNLLQRAVLEAGLMDCISVYDMSLSKEAKPTPDISHADTGNGLSSRASDLPETGRGFQGSPQGTSPGLAITQRKSPECQIELIQSPPSVSHKTGSSTHLSQAPESPKVDSQNSKMLYPRETKMFPFDDEGGDMLEDWLSDKSVIQTTGSPVADFDDILAYCSEYTTANSYRKLEDEQNLEQCETNISYLEDLLSENAPPDDTQATQRVPDPSPKSVVSNEQSEEAVEEVFDYIQKLATGDLDMQYSDGDKISDENACVSLNRSPASVAEPSSGLQDSNLLHDVTNASNDDATGRSGSIYDNNVQSGINDFNRSKIVSPNCFVEDQLQSPPNNWQELATSPSSRYYQGYQTATHETNSSDPQKYSSTAYTEDREDTQVCHGTDELLEPSFLGPSVTGSDLSMRSVDKECVPKQTTSPENNFVGDVQLLSSTHFPSQSQTPEPYSSTLNQHLSMKRAEDENIRDHKIVIKDEDYMQQFSHHHHLSDSSTDSNSVEDEFEPTESQPQDLGINFSSPVNKASANEFTSSFPEDRMASGQTSDSVHESLSPRSIILSPKPSPFKQNRFDNQISSQEEKNVFSIFSPDTPIKEDFDEVALAEEDDTYQSEFLEPSNIAQTQDDTVSLRQYETGCNDILGSEVTDIYYTTDDVRYREAEQDFSGSTNASQGYRLNMSTSDSVQSGLDDCKMIQTGEEEVQTSAEYDRGYSQVVLDENSNITGEPLKDIIPYQEYTEVSPDFILGNIQAAEVGHIAEMKQNEYLTSANPQEIETFPGVFENDMLLPPSQLNTYPEGESREVTLSENELNELEECTGTLDDLNEYWNSLQENT